MANQSLKIFIVYAHHEPNSFNYALFETATKVLTEQGHQVKVSDLYAMNWDPVSDRRNFTTTKDANYLKQQMEEMYATEHGGFTPAIEEEIAKMEW